MPDVKVKITIGGHWNELNFEGEYERFVTTLKEFRDSVETDFRNRAKQDELRFELEKLKIEKGIH